jgi:hypothetical protein
MMRLLNVVNQLYLAVWRLYPRDFREEFGEEMRDIFRQKSGEAILHGWRGLAAICLRELLDLPGVLAWLYKAKLRELRTMNGQRIGSSITWFRPDGERGSWKSAFLSGLPHLLIALGTGGSRLLQSYMLPEVQQGDQRIVTFSLILFCTIIIAALFYAWRHSWPRWSGSWISYGMWMGMATLFLTADKLGLLDDWRVSNTLVLGMLAVVVVSYLLLMWRDTLMGLLAAFILFPMYSPSFLEFVPDQVDGMVYIGFGLLTALGAMGLVRLGDWRVGLILALGVNILAGISLSYVGVYQAVEVPAGTFSPSLVEMVVYLAGYILVSTLLIAGPALFMKYLNLRLRGSQV